MSLILQSWHLSSDLQFMGEESDSIRLNFLMERGDVYNC